MILVFSCLSSQELQSRISGLEEETPSAAKYSKLPSNVHLVILWFILVPCHLRREESLVDGLSYVYVDTGGVSGEISVGEEGPHDEGGKSVSEYVDLLSRSKPAVGEVREENVYCLLFN